MTKLGFVGFFKRSSGTIRLSLVAYDRFSLSRRILGELLLERGYRTAAMTYIGYPGYRETPNWLNNRAYPTAADQVAAACHLGFGGPMCSQTR